MSTNVWSADNSTGTTDMGIWDEPKPVGMAPQIAKKAIVKDVNTPPAKKKANNKKTLDDFKSQMSSFARTNLFEVRIFAKPDSVEKPLQERLRFSCYQATVPGMTIATTEKDEGYRSIAYQKIYEDVTLGFYVHGDMKELKIFQDWMKMMIQPEDNHVGYYDSYTSTIEIKNLNRKQEDVLTTTLYDAYPKTLSAVTLDAGSNDDLIKVTVGFTYRHYKQKYGGKQETVAKGLNEITSIQRKNLTDGIIDKTLTLKQRKEIFDGTVNEVEQEEF
jgi:hypothetical protein